MAAKILKMLKKIVLVLILLCGLLIIFMLIPKNTLDLKLPTSGNLEKTPIPRKTLKDAKIVGWTAYWDERNTLRALSLSMERYSVFTPVLYRIDPNGTLGKYTVLYRKEFLEMARVKNIPIMPQIGDDFDFGRVKLLLENKDVQDRFLNSMVEEAKKEDFAGWDIDIESLNKSDKDAFSNFASKMAETLHKNNLRLAITVFARVGSDDNPSALAQDYKVIGKAADEVRIMMYGAHDDETKPGGQAPLEWVRKVLKYATENIAREKIVIGLSTHGYDWTDEKGEPLTFPQIITRIGEATPSVQFDEKVSSAIFQYQKRGQDRVIWFENARSITEKMLIAMNEYGVTRFAIWRIGAEDPELWEELSKN